MADFKEKYGPWAVVAGAAEGLGRSFCISLAQRKMNIIMIDFKEGSLKELSQKISSDYGIEVLPVFLDLIRDDAWETIADISDKYDCGLLVYNAAYSKVKPFLEQSHNDLDSHLFINNRTLTHLVHCFTGRWKNRRQGGILVMASLAGLFGTGFVPTYSASKAYCLTLAEALHFELKRYNIDILACLAGATATPAFLATNPARTKFGPSVMNPEIVAEKALRKLGSKNLYIPGYFNRLSYFFLQRLLPRKVAAGIVNTTMDKMYGNKNSG
ncbi:MAG: SDR family NAD(P)-dependent oxidoreductase [Bacteroidetes bacterium]|nr:SDR family NAD(P)-dependent oxidoreductase [Bacteroidota bacterium]